MSPLSATEIMSPLSAVETVSPMNKGDAILTEKVRKRIFVMGRLIARQITNAQAAKSLRLSVRQIRRIRKEILGSGQHICAIRCMFVAKCPSAWPFAMCLFSEQVIVDASRIRISADAYRNAYPHKRREWNDLATATAGCGMIWPASGSLCQSMPS